MKREYLINELEELQSDEFNPSEVMYLTKKEIIIQIIASAHYYKDETNKLM